MTYFEKKIHKALVNLLKRSEQELSKIFRDKVNLYVGIKENSLNIIEAGMELGIVNFVIYKGKKYPLRTLILSLPEEEEDTHVIASQELFDDLGYDPTTWNIEANNIDQSIYFYVAREDFFSSGEHIAKNCIDEIYKFHGEL